MQALGGQIAPLAVFFLAAPYLLRGLGPPAFGVLTLFVTANALVASIDFGLSAGGTRSLGTTLHTGDPDLFRIVMREWWSAYVTLGVLVGALALFAGPWLGKMMRMHLEMEPLTGKVALYAFGVSAISSYGSAACQLVARAHERFAGITLIQAGAGILLWGGLACVVYAGGGINGALLWVGLVAVLTFIGHARWAWRISGGWSWLPTFHYPRVRRSAAYCLHVFWGQLAGGATYQADKFIVSHNLGAAHAGQYGLATNIASKLLMLVATIASFVFPRAVRLHSADEKEGIRLTYIRASRYTLLVSWPIFALMVLLAAPFLRLWLGHDAAVLLTVPMQLLLVAYFINSLSVVASNIFNGLGDAGIGARFSSIGGLLTVLGGILITPWAGITGAAGAALLASCQVFFYNHQLHKRMALGHFPLASLWRKLAIAITIPLLVVTMASMGRLSSTWAGLFVSAAAGWILFYAIWFFAGFADEGDRRLLGRLSNWIGGRLPKTK